MRKISKTMLYLSSFFPLFILLIIQNLEIRDITGNFFDFKNFLVQFQLGDFSSANFFFWFTVTLFLIVSGVSIVSFFYVYIGSDGSEGKVLGSSFERADTLGYIVTYIVPLTSMNINSWRSIVVNYLLFLVIGIFYIKNNQFFMNPIFNIIGYNILLSDAGKVYITKLSPRRLKELAKENESIIIKNVSEEIDVIKEVRKK